VTSNDGLDVQAVVDRFDESEQALQDVRQRLRGLVSAEESAGQAAASMQQASQALTSAAKALEAAVTEVQEVRTTTIAALDAAREFLAGTDLSSLRQEVAALAEAMPKAEDARAELEALKLRIPERMRKKFGI
jgi:chromosome segregation ATPase